MESSESQQNGLRLGKNVEETHSSDEDMSDSEDVKTDLVKRIIESTKDCMPTDLPSAKRMVSVFRSDRFGDVIDTTLISRLCLLMNIVNCPTAGGWIPRSSRLQF